MNTPQRGFTLLETLVAVIVVAVLGLGGYYVWHQTSHKKANATTTNSLASKNGKSPAKAAIVKGSITGKLGYPSEFLPDETVCVVDVSGGSPTCFDKPLTGADELSYKIDVNPGHYYVYAHLDTQTGDVTSSYKAYYNQYVVCGISASCPASGHTQYIVVPVSAGVTTPNIDPTDWYNF